MATQDMTINPGYLRTCNHFPRETATVTPSKQLWRVVTLVCIPLLRKLCLINRDVTWKAISDQQIYKIEKLYLVNRDLEDIEVRSIET